MKKVKTYQWSVVHAGLACSTIVIGDFGYADDDPADMLARLENTLAIPKTEEKCNCGCGDLVEVRAVADHGIVVASVDTEEQHHAVSFFRKLGFTETGPVYNQKNSTECSLFSATIPDALTAIDRMKKESKK